MVSWLRNGVEKSWSSISVCLLCNSQKRVLSGVVVFLVLLTVSLFNVSFKTPFLYPIFQGFDSFSSNSSYFSNATDAKLASSLDFMQTGDTPLGNVSDIVKDDSRNKGDFEDALLRNSSDLVEDVIDSRNGGDFEDALLRNSSELVKVVSDSRSGGDFEDALLRNSSDLVKDESFAADRNVTGEKTIEGKFEEEKGNGSLVGESVGSGNDLSFGNGTSVISSGHKLSNYSDNGENGEWLPSPAVKIPVVSTEKVNATIFTKQSQVVEMQKTSLEKCDIFDGRWVRDNTKPYYPAGSCPHIDTVFDCYLNKRPDSEFVKWRWQPNDCDIPSVKIQ